MSESANLPLISGHQASSSFLYSRKFWVSIAVTNILLFSAAVAFLRGESSSSSLSSSTSASASSTVHSALRGASEESFATPNPVVAILTQPTADFVDNAPQFASQYKSYLAASYVKWLESAGARVMPIRYDVSEKELLTALDQVNGVLFMGGAVLTPAYNQTVTRVLKYATAANQKGDYFPLWGTCQGFEALIMQVVPDNRGFDLLKRVVGDDFTITLNQDQVKKAAKSGASRLFASAPSWLLEDFRTYHHHYWGYLVQDFLGEKSITDFWKLITTEVDIKGQEYVSYVEARDFPFYASQWHPEKPQFEWHQSSLDHSPISLTASAFQATFFVNECRKSGHKFVSQAAMDQALIYNFEPTYTAAVLPSFRQIYFF
eukprot:GILI01008122.1.p1 GENE.GILI01008122.1~~GILI01008122.1.p1  ORF type:complete len:407 (+),score=93.92 GILI01008122.1:97-1221(+)